MSDRRLIHIIDDEEAIRRSASFMLKTSGFAAEGWASARHRGYDGQRESAKVRSLEQRSRHDHPNVHSAGSSVMRLSSQPGFPFLASRPATIIRPTGFIGAVCLFFSIPGDSGSPGTGHLRILPP